MAILCLYSPFLASVESLFWKPKYWANIFNYLFFFFIYELSQPLLFTVRVSFFF